MRISRFSQTILASLVMSIGLIQIFIIGLQNKMGIYFYPEMVNYAFYLSIIPAIGVMIVFLVLDIFRPFYFQLRKLKLRKVDPKTVTRRYEELCDNNELEVRPSIYVANNPIPFSLGIHKGSSMIIVPECLLSFEEEERESVVAHELWHVRNDVEAAYLRIFETASGALFTITFLSVLLLVYFQHSVLGWWNNMIITDNYTFISYEYLFSPNFLWVGFVAFTFPLVFTFSATILRALTGFPAFLHKKNREQMADLCGSIETGNPLIMAQTIRKMEHHANLQKIVGGSFVTEIGFISSISKIDSMVRLLLGMKIAQDDGRLSHLCVLNEMTNSSVALEWRDNLSSLSMRFRISFLIFASRISFGRTFSAVPRNAWERVIKYMWNNRENFNLKRCSEQTGTSLKNSFLVFYLLSEEEVVSVKKSIEGHN